MWWAILSAFAAEPSDEIIVWGDRFARWERRWYVETEVNFLEPQVEYARVVHEMRVKTLQVRAVLDCGIDFVLGPGSREVSCTVEDIALVAAPVLPAPSDPALLDEIDADLTGAVVQLQVRESGKVPNVDLEGIATGNPREVARREHLRQIMSRVILPFHLQMEEVVRDGMQWYEYNSLLFQLPTQQWSRGTRLWVGGTATHGGSTMAHFLNGIDPEHFVIQSIGEATVVNPHSGNMVALEMHGVSLVQRDTGILSERVWVVRGGQTASSLRNLSGRGWYHAGALRMLGQTEQVDVGGTWVASSGKRKDDRPPWVPLAPAQ